MDTRNKQYFDAYSDIFEWLDISESDLQTDVDLQNQFQIKIKTQYTTQHTCIRALKFIQHYQLSGKKNFTAAIFEFASATDFSKKNNPSEMIIDFYQQFPIPALKALLLDESPDLRFINRIIEFGKKNKAKMQFIYPLSMQCIEKSLQSQPISILYESLIKILENASSDPSQITEYLFTVALNILAKKAKDAETPPQRESMEIWIKTIAQLAQKNNKTNLILFNSAIEAYAHSDSPNSKFALSLINFAQKEIEKQNSKDLEIGIYFANSIYLSSKTNNLKLSIALYKEAAKEKYLNDSMGYSLLINLENGYAKPDDLSDFLLNILSLQEQHTKIEVRFYSKIFDVLTKLQIADSNLSTNIIKRAKEHYKLNEIMLAHHFSIMLKDSNKIIDDHFIENQLALYYSMQKQTQRFKNKLNVPTLYKNLILLIARCDRPDINQAECIFIDAKKFLNSITAEVYDAMLTALDKSFISFENHSELQKQEYISRIVPLIQEAIANGLYPNQNPTQTKSETSLGKLYFQIKKELFRLIENPPSNSLSISISEDESNKSIFLNALALLSSEFKHKNLSLTYSQSSTAKFEYQISLIDLQSKEPFSEKSSQPDSSANQSQGYKTEKNSKKKKKKKSKSPKAINLEQESKIEEKSAEMMASVKSEIQINQQEIINSSNLKTGKFEKVIPSEAEPVINDAANIDYNLVMSSHDSSAESNKKMAIHQNNAYHIVNDAIQSETPNEVPENTKDETRVSSIESSIFEDNHEKSQKESEHDNETKIKELLKANEPELAEEEPIQWIKKERASATTLTSKQDLAKALLAFNEESHSDENPYDLIEYIHQIKRQSYTLSTQSIPNEYEYICQIGLSELFMQAYMQCALAFAKWGIKSINNNDTYKDINWKIVDTTNTALSFITRTLQRKIKKNSIDQMFNNINLISYLLVFRFFKKISCTPELSKTLNLFLNHFQIKEYDILILKLSQLDLYQDKKNQKNILDLIHHQDLIFIDLLSNMRLLLAVSFDLTQKGQPQREDYAKTQQYERNEFIYNLTVVIRKFIEDVEKILKYRETKLENLTFYRPCNGLSLNETPHQNRLEIHPKEINIHLNFDKDLIPRELNISLLHFLSRVLLIEYLKPNSSEHNSISPIYWHRLLAQMEKAFSAELYSHEKPSVLETHLARQFYLHAYLMDRDKGTASIYAKHLKELLTIESNVNAEALVAIKFWDQNIALRSLIEENPTKKNKQEFFHNINQFSKELKEVVLKNSADQNQTIHNYPISLTYPIAGAILLTTHLPSSEFFKPDNLENHLSETRLNKIQENMPKLNEYKFKLNQLIHFYNTLQQIFLWLTDHLNAFSLIESKWSLLEINQKILELVPKKIHELESEKNTFNQKNEKLHQRLSNSMPYETERENQNKKTLEGLEKQIQQNKKQIQNLKDEETISNDLDALLHENEMSKKGKRYFEAALNKLKHLDYSGAFLEYQKLSKTKNHFLEGKDGMFFCQFKELMQEFCRAQEAFEIKLNTYNHLNHENEQKFNLLLIYFKEKIETFLKDFSCFEKAIREIELNLKIQNTQSKVENSKTVIGFSVDSINEYKKSHSENFTYYQTQLNDAFNSFNLLKLKINESNLLYKSKIENSQSKKNENKAELITKIQLTSKPNSPQPSSSKSKNDTTSSKKKNNKVKNQNQKNKGTTQPQPQKTNDQNLSKIEAQNDQPLLAQPENKESADNHSILPLLVKGIFDCFSDLNEPKNKKESKKKELASLIETEAKYNLIEWDSATYSKIYQFIFDYFLSDYSSMKERYQFLTEIGFIIKILFFKKSISDINKTHSGIIATIDKIQKQIEITKDHDQINKELILAHLFSAIALEYTDRKSISSHLSMLENIESPLFIIAQVAKASATCELYFYLLLSVNHITSHEKYSLNPTLKKLREKMISHNIRILNEANIHKSPLYLFSCALDPLSRMFKKKGAKQIYIKTNLSSNEFEFKTSIVTQFDTPNNDKVLSYKHQLQAQRLTLQFLIKDAEVFQDTAFVSFTVNHILFDYLTMQPRYGTLQAKQDVESQQLNWLESPDKMSKNFSNVVIYLYYVSKLKLPLNQSSFQILKNRMNQLIRDSIEKKNEFIPYGLIGKQDLNKLMLFIASKNSVHYFRCLAESHLIFFILPIPIQLYPFSKKLISAISSELNNLTIKENDKTHHSAQKFAAILYYSLTLSDIKFEKSDFEKIKMVLKSFPLESHGQEIIKRFEELVNLNSNKAVHQTEISITTASIFALPQNAPITNANVLPSANAEVQKSDFVKENKFG